MRRVRERGGCGRREQAGIMGIALSRLPPPPPQLLVRAAHIRCRRSAAAGPATVRTVLLRSRPAVRAEGAAAADGGVAAVAGQLRRRVLHPFGEAARGLARRLGGKRAERAVEASMAAAAAEKTEAAAAAATAEVGKRAAAAAAG